MGAELVALAGMSSHLAGRASTERGTETHMKLDATLIDSAPCHDLLQKLYDTLTTPPELSPYASATAKAKNRGIVEPQALSMDFVQADLLDLEGRTGDGVNERLGRADVITLFFTLNELYNQSIPKTQRFLLDITRPTRKGTLLVVVDSAGSYSTASFGDNNGIGGDDTDKQKARTYPTSWLLDHALLTQSLEFFANPPWEKVGSQSTDSKWYRIPPELQDTKIYPIQLENMRYQMQVYRRL